MAKKIFFLTSLALFLFSIFSIVSFAKVDNTTTELGDEVTSSMNKTERSMEDLANETNLDNVGRTIENGARTVGNVINNGIDTIRQGIEDTMTDENDASRKNENRAVAGETRDYGAGQLQQTEETMSRNGMTQNAWIWIVMAVIALVIIATVWFYAAQRRD